MKNTINIFVLLMNFCMVGMEMPINEPKTYFSLLPLDIIKVKVGDTNFEQFDNEIARLKLIASQQPEFQKKLLSDVDYVNSLIKQLATEYDLSEFEVALMLNTPASLKIFKEMPLLIIPGYGDPYHDFSTDTKIIYIIKEQLKKIRKDPNPNQHEKADNAIRYVKRFLNHPLVEEQLIFSRGSNFYYTILIPIDAIQRGLHNFKDRHDGNQDAMAWYRNAIVTQEYLDIAIRFAAPIALEEVIYKMNLYAEGVFADSVITYTMQKTLAQAFKNKNQDSINFILDIFVKAVENRNFRINKNTFTKYENRFSQYGDRYKITFQEFIESIISYIQTTGDYAILNKLIKILLASEVKNIVTELLKYNIDQKTLTKELLNQFLSLGLDLNEPDKNGEYPLIKAIKSKSSSMVAELLATNQINVQICQDGHNALWYAENTEDMNFADRRSMIELLKRAGVTEEVEKCAIQ